MRTFTIDNRPSRSNPVEVDDSVIFSINGKEEHYVVYDRYLRHVTGYNATIFELLKLNKEKLAERAYSYPPIGGDNEGAWPESKEYDFLALTRLINQLYDKIRYFNKPKDIPKPVKVIDPSKKYTGHINGVLEYDDTVIFETPDGDRITYVVRHNHLYNSGSGDNEEIFGALSLSSEQKHKWATMSYGYGDSEGTCWPGSKDEDYQALTRFVNEIYRIIALITDDLDQGWDADRDTVWNYITSLHNHKKETPKTIKDNLIINQKTLQNGKTIKTFAVTPAIRRGEKRTGCTIRGKASRSTTRIGYLTNRTIIG